MTTRTGSITVNTQDILPIIKKWLYSEHDIFLRELVSNSSDAITKRSTIARVRNEAQPAPLITLEIDSENKCLKIHDNGLGMTEAEVEKYIAKLAFSGAEEFVAQMKAQGVEKQEIIGKFGLGFYSVFMVADRVTIDTLSMEAGAVACQWQCDGSTDYSFNSSEKTEIGTTITAYLNSESMEFLERHKVEGILRRYCDFMPYPIYLIETANAKKEEKPESEKTPINLTTPLWKKDPTTLTDEDYLNFYRRQFPMDPDPLFWIHLKVDHPFELLGILYFPKLNPNRPLNEQNIRLYAKQVFVSDNVKNIIPDFLALLKGHIDSSDIPLNVSRSSLQGDPNIKKISNYIVKKVSESLKKLFNNDRPKYEKIWEDIGLFVKYGCVSDTKFDEAMGEMVIFKNTKGEMMTLPEYINQIPEKFKEKLKDKILYTEENKTDSFLVRQIQAEGLEAIKTELIIDPHFMQHLEVKKVGDKSYHFASLSSEIENLLTQESSTEATIQIKELFEKVLKPEEGKDKDKEMDIEAKSYKDTDCPAYFKIDESMRRLQHMTRTMGGGDFPIKKTLVINTLHPLVQNAFKIWEKGENRPLAEKLMAHIKDLASLSSEGLTNHEDKENFICRSQELVKELTNLIA